MSGLDSLPQVEALRPISCEVSGIATIKIFASPESPLKDALGIALTRRADHSAGAGGRGRGPGLEAMIKDVGRGSIQPTAFAFASARMRRKPASRSCSRMNE